MGLDRDTFNLVMASIKDYAEHELDDATLIEIDTKDAFPEEIVRGLCGDVLGVSLLFIPEEYGGMGGDAFDVYRVSELLAGILKKHKIPHEVLNAKQHEREAVIVQQAGRAGAVTIAGCTSISW